MNLITILLTCIAWLFPFTEQPIESAWYQLVACGLFAAIAGMHARAMVGRVMLVLVLLAGVLILNSGVYVSDVWMALAALVLAGLGWNLGKTQASDAVGSPIDAVLMGTMLAATVAAVEGLLQYLGLVGGLWPWVPDPLMRGVAYGIFRQSNLFATMLCCGLACIFHFAQRKTISHAMAWLLVAIVHIGIAASGSRIGVLEALLFAVLGLCWVRQQSGMMTRLMVGQLFVLTLAAILMPWLAQLHGFEPRSLADRLIGISRDSRLLIWKDALVLIAEKPLLGWGWAEFAYAHFMMSPTGRFNPDSIVNNAHNMPLHLAVELGVPVALCLCGAVVWLLLRAQPWRAAARLQQAPCLVVLALGLHSLVEFPLWYAGFLFLTALCLAAIQPTAPHGVPTLALPIPSWQLWVARGVAVFLIGFCAVGWLQYQKIIDLYNTPARDKTSRMHMVNEAQAAWLFKGQVDYAAFGLLRVDQDPPELVRDNALTLLHFVAEPRVIQGLLFALGRLNDTAQLQAYARRYCVAFPAAYLRWVRVNSDLPVIQQIRATGFECQPP